MSVTSPALRQVRQDEKRRTGNQYIKGILKKASVMIKDQYCGKQDFEQQNMASKKRLRFADDCGESLVEIHEVAKIQYYTWWSILVADDDALCAIC